MLALAIEFSRCSRIRTLKAEQCVLMTIRLAGRSFAPREELLTAACDPVSKE